MECVGEEKIERSERTKKISKVKKKTKNDERVETILLRVDQRNISTIGAFQELYPLIPKSKDMHSQVLQTVLPFLDPSDEKLFESGWKLVWQVSRKKPEIFEEFSYLVFEILQRPTFKESLRLSCYNDLAIFSPCPKWLESKINYLLDIIKKSENLSDRRTAFHILKSFGSKIPHMAGEFVPVFAEYLKSPDTFNLKKKDEKNTVTKTEIGDLGISFTISYPTGPDDSVMLLADCIDAIGEIGSKDPEIVKECIPYLDEISKKTTGNYTIKKASEALEKIGRATPETPKKK